MTKHYEFIVQGMTCGHCEMSVVEEVSEVAGVQNVAASHQSGKLTFDADREINSDDIAEAVKEAGYELVN